jgi:hypothetical protein
VQHAFLTEFRRLPLFAGCPADPIGIKPHNLLNFLKPHPIYGYRFHRRPAPPSALLVK